MIPLTNGAWNVCTLMDKFGSARPQRRTALVGRELDWYKVEIAALSETRLAQEGLLKEVGAGYTLFWSGRKKEEGREAGAGFAIKSHLVSKLSGIPKGINDCLMLWDFPYLVRGIQLLCLCTHNDQPRWGQRQVLWWSRFCDFCYIPDRQTHLLRRLQC